MSHGVYHTVLHDTRLDGKAHHIGRVVAVNESYTLDRVVTLTKKLGMATDSSGQLIILCHGSTASLQLSKDYLTRKNVAKTAPWHGLFDEIYLYSCEIAPLAFGENPHKHHQFCRDLARHTNSTVYASDTTQWFNTSFFFNEIDFGKWEGHVYAFPPSGGGCKQVVIKAHDMS